MAKHIHPPQANNKPEATNWNSESLGYHSLCAVWLLDCTVVSSHIAIPDCRSQRNPSATVGGSRFPTVL